jgi:hypothetical protein
LDIISDRLLPESRLLRLICHGISSKSGIIEEKSDSVIIIIVPRTNISKFQPKRVIAVVAESEPNEWR